MEGSYVSVRIGQSLGIWRFLGLLAAAIGLTGVGIWQVERHYEIIARGYQIDRDLFEYRRTLEREKRLELMISAYQDPTALQVFAEEELGMHAPSIDDELLIPDPRASEPLKVRKPSAPPPAPSLPEEDAETLPLHDEQANP